MDGLCEQCRAALGLGAGGAEAPAAAGVCRACLGATRQALRDAAAAECVRLVGQFDPKPAQVALSVVLPAALGLREAIARRAAGVDASIDLVKGLQGAVADKLAAIGVKAAAAASGAGGRHGIAMEVRLAHADAERQGLEIYREAMASAASQQGSSGDQRKRKRRRGGDEPERLTSEQGRKLAAALTHEDAAARWAQAATSEPCTFEVSWRRDPVLVAGNYIKLQRGLTQTPWFVDGQRRGEQSVEELLCEPLQRATSARAYKFHSAGREDMDVRMLGKGRPFVVELLDAAKLPDQALLSRVEAEEINADPQDRLRVAGLRLAAPDAMDQLLLGERSKRKQYTCLVWTERRLQRRDLGVLNRIKDLELNQKTPLRVLHRRSAMDRAKVIHTCECEYINGNFFVLRLEASAGTYIKEFVHGDFGRTQPNVGAMLGCRADILQLDVEKVILDADLTAAASK